MRMNADKRDLFLYEAFLYFNPLLLMVSIMMSYTQGRPILHFNLPYFILDLYTIDLDGLALGS